MRHPCQPRLNDAQAVLYGCGGCDDDTARQPFQLPHVTQQDSPLFTSGKHQRVSLLVGTVSGRIFTALGSAKTGPVCLSIYIRFREIFFP